MKTDATKWWEGFLWQVEQPDQMAKLKSASLDGNLGQWTRLTTQAVVRACETAGWQAAARGHRLHLLPESGEEYLAIDVMAFAGRPDEGTRWRFPVAAFELENSPQDDRVAYALWKVMCLRVPLRFVFAYRRDWEQARKLIEHFDKEVLGSLPLANLTELGGETLCIVGSRGEGETFPWGFFKSWKLDSNLVRFFRS